MKFIFINTVLTSCKNLGNFGVKQNRIGVENVVVFGFYCEESVNLDLGPGNVLGEAFFSSCKVLTGAVSGATGQIGEIRQPFWTGGSYHKETV